jgi:hypothetical protein
MLIDTMRLKEAVWWTFMSFILTVAIQKLVIYSLWDNTRVLDKTSNHVGVFCIGVLMVACCAAFAACVSEKRLRKTNTLVTATAGLVGVTMTVIGKAYNWHF